MIVVPAANFLEMASFAAQKESRYYLEGVYIHKGAAGDVRLAAMDGHVLAVCSLEEGTAIATHDAIVRSVKADRNFLSTLKSRMRDPHPRYLVVDDRGHAHVVFAADASQATEVAADAESILYLGRFNGATIDGGFPDYERMVPTGPFSTTVPEGLAFDPALLGRFAGFGFSQMLFGEPWGCALLRFAGRPDVVGVVMGARGDADLKGLPGWLSLSALETAE